jgi:hypothetical protein
VSCLGDFWVRISEIGTSIVFQNSQTVAVGDYFLLTRVEDGRKFKAITDKEGDFEFEPLQAGKYKLEPNTKPDLWTRWYGDTEVKQHGCTDFDLDYRINGVIAGKLIFPKGIDPSKWEVNATPADEPDVFLRQAIRTKTGDLFFVA